MREVRVRKLQIFVKQFFVIIKHKELEFTIWDHFTFKENVTLEHLIDKLKVTILNSL